MTTWHEALQEGTRQLAAVSPTARLDSEWLLCHVLDAEPKDLFARGPSPVAPAKYQAFLDLVSRRKAGSPVAYLTGHAGFWTLDLRVSPETLIPRPDTETLVEVVLAHHAPTSRLAVADLGTGTGAIALALASERPLWSVIGTDFRADIVALARYNARHNQLPGVRFLVSHWGRALAGASLDILVSNPPYVRENDEHLLQGDVRSEPASALVSGADGLSDIRLIADEAPGILRAGGWLYLEHGYDQGRAVRETLLQSGFRAVGTQRDLGGQERVTFGQC